MVTLTPMPTTRRDSRNENGQNGRVQNDLQKLKSEHERSLSIIQQENESLRTERDKYRSSLIKTRQELFALQTRFDEVEYEVADLKRKLARAELTIPLPDSDVFTDGSESISSPRPVTAITLRTVATTRPKSTPAKRKRLIPFVSVPPMRHHAKRVRDRTPPLQTSSPAGLSSQTPSKRRRMINGQGMNGMKTTPTSQAMPKNRSISPSYGSELLYEPD